MRWPNKFLLIWVGLTSVFLTWQPTALAQALPLAPAIAFDSFNGTYHLSRDANGRSLLTSEEVILADFPGNGQFYGITRSIPKTYQGRSVDVRVLNVTDASGNPVPYKTASDKSGELVLTIGDNGITIYGLQTYRISYQTRDVINLNTPQNQFLLNVNGRGWSQPFNQVSAVVHLPASFSADLTSKPSCYIGYLNATSLECSVTTQKQAGETVITSKAIGQVAPQHALVVKLNFKLATFTAPKSFWTNGHQAIVGVTVLAVVMSGLWRFKNRH